MIEHSARPLGFGDDFIPPQPESPFSSNSLAFMFINVLTAGVYGSIETLSKNHKIVKLEVKQEELQSKAQKLLYDWEELEGELGNVYKSLKEARAESEGGTVETPLITVIKQQLRNIDVRKDEIKLTYISSRLDYEESVGRLALDCIAFFGQLIANVVTLGLYGAYRNHVLKNRINLLEQQNTYLNRVIAQDLKTGKADRLSHQIEEIRLNLSTQEEIEAIKNTDPAQAREAAKQAQARIEIVLQELQALNNEHTTLKVERQRLQQANNTLETRASLSSNELSRLRRENTDLLRQNRAQESEVINLKNQINTYRRDLDLANEAAIRVVELQRQVQQLQTVQRSGPQIQRVQEQLGPIPPKYTRRKPIEEVDEEGEIQEVGGDGEIKGAYGLENGEDEEDKIAEYVKLFNGKKTAAEVVQVGLDFAIDHLLAKGQEKDAKIVFNTSAEIYQDVKFLPNKNAVYRWLALYFIENAKLYQVDCHAYGLKLNNEDVLMASSNPERVLAYREDPTTLERKPEVRILPTRIDEFTPPISDVVLPFGIDPASAKWIFARLSEEDRGHLYNLLMDPLIPEENLELQATRLFMNQPNNERVKLVRTAYELICDIATSFSVNFEKKVLNQAWGKLDEYDETIKPLEKKEFQVEILEPTEAPIVPWTPNVEAMFNTTNNSRLHQEFVQSIWDAKDAYQALFNEMSKELVQNPLDRGYDVQWRNTESSLGDRYGISHQYHASHELLNNQECLFSNLLAILMSQKSDVTEYGAKSLRHSLAAYLDNETNAGKFKDLILSVHGKSVPQYQRWLREEGGSIGHYNYGEVEITLAAHVFGVKIAVFVTGEKTKINEYGLMVPADPKFYFGPNTEETLYLYNSPGSTYYGLWPKFKTGVLKGDDERINQDLITYWNRLDKP